MTATATPASDILAWAQSIPVSDKFTRTSVTPGAPTLPAHDGWRLNLLTSGNLWKITGRRASVIIIADRLSADQVSTFDPNTWGRPTNQGATK